jgi:hypothetical protein
MMTLHPAHALLLANTRHHELVTRADDFRLSRLAGAARAQPDCAVPVPLLAVPCRPDPRRAAARPIARHRVLLRLHR